MSYDAPPQIADPPRCQAQCAEDVSDFPSMTYHACTKGQHMPHHHLCACGWVWQDEAWRPEPTEQEQSND